MVKIRAAKLRKVEVRFIYFYFLANDFEDRRESQNWALHYVSMELSLVPLLGHDVILVLIGQLVKFTAWSREGVQAMF